MAQGAATKMQKAIEPETEQEALRREPSEEEIRVRAYEIYLARGAASGFELDDWLEAERELRMKS